MRSVLRYLTAKLAESWQTSVNTILHGNSKSKESPKRLEIRVLVWH